MSDQHLCGLNLERRHAVLVTTVPYLFRHLTDGAIGMFKKLMSMLTQRTDNQAAARVIRSVREVLRPSRGVSEICHAIIKTREKGENVAR